MGWEAGTAIFLKDVITMYAPEPEAFLHVADAGSSNKAATLTAFRHRPGHHAGGAIAMMIVVRTGAAVIGTRVAGMGTNRESGSSKQGIR